METGKKYQEYGKKEIDRERQREKGLEEREKWHWGREEYSMG